ncbi:MAG: hypothetical protein ACKVWR_04810 [Acidimicrobiales bacterium]
MRRPTAPQLAAAAAASVGLLGLVGLGAAAAGGIGRDGGSELVSPAATAVPRAVPPAAGSQAQDDPEPRSAPSTRVAPPGSTTPSTSSTEPGRSGSMSSVNDYLACLKANGVDAPDVGGNLSFSLQNTNGKVTIVVNGVTLDPDQLARAQGACDHLMPGAGVWRFGQSLPSAPALLEEYRRCLEEQANGSEDDRGRGDARAACAAKLPGGFDSDRFGAELDDLLDRFFGPGG